MAARAVDQGARAIATALTNAGTGATSLRELELKFNLFGPDGLAALQACAAAWRVDRRELEFSSRKLG